MLLIEILDLVQIQQNAAGAEYASHLRDDLPHVGEGSRGGVQSVELHAGIFGNDVGGGGLSRAGRAKEDHVADLSRGQHTAENASLANQMLLAYHIVKGFGANLVGRRLTDHSRLLLKIT